MSDWISQTEADKLKANLVREREQNTRADARIADLEHQLAALRASADAVLAFAPLQNPDSEGVFRVGPGWAAEYEAFQKLRAELERK